MARVARIDPNSPHIERPFGWKTWRVETPETTGFATASVFSFPQGTVIKGGAATTVRPAVGGTLTLIGFLASQGLISLNAASLGATNLGNDETVLSAINAALAVGSEDLIIIGTITGTLTQLPLVDVHVLCGRNDLR